ncbi:hypothetical protein AAK706_04520 [Erysipelotrichaceae bacterium 66-17]
MNLKEYIELNGEREIVDIEALEKCLKPKKQKTIYDIKKYDPYFILTLDGSILKDEWNGWRSEEDMRSMGFVSLTEKEAEIRKKMLMIDEELIRLGGRREFKVCGFNYFLNFNTISESTVYALAGTYMGNEIYFDTEDQARKAVEQIGEQRLIDEYFKPRMIFEEDQE